MIKHARSLKGGGGGVKPITREVQGVDGLKHPVCVVVSSRNLDGVDLALLSVY